MHPFVLPQLPETPLVSVLLNVRNGEATVRRCIEGVLRQEYQNIEFIIQDGLSTDQTLDIIRSYPDERIQLVSAADSHPEEGFFAALRRCRGEIIGSSMADEELLPNATQWAMDQFRKHPDAVAVYGQTYTTDLEGNILGEFTPKHPFSLETYLCHQVVPCFAATFFRREALEAAGIQNRHWSLGCGEFELWLRTCALGPVCYEPGIVTKYAVHQGARSSSEQIMDRLLQARQDLLTRWFAEPERSDEERSLHSKALGGMFLWASQSMYGAGHMDAAVRFATEAVQHDPPGRFLNEVASHVFGAAKDSARAGDTEKAIHLLDITDALGARFPHLHLERGLCQLRAGKVPEAMRDFARELERHPTESDLAALLADFFRHVQVDYHPEWKAPPE